MLRYRLRRIAQKGLLAVAATASTFIVLESGARIHVRLHPPTGQIERWDFRSGHPPAYQTAAYFSKAFLTESMTCQRDFVNPSKTQYWIPGAFSGKLFHVSDGRRQTAYQPAVSENKVLLFGGSTVFCTEVPDSETVASHLQLLINESTGPRLAVENYGVPAMNSAQQYARMQTIQLRPGDIVAFYDGVNDVYYPVYNGNLRGWPPGDSHDGGLRKLNWIQRGMHRAFLEYGDQSALVRLLFNVQARALPHAIADDKTLDRNVAQAEISYRKALAAANDLAAQSGAKFFHFLQPNIFTMSHPSTHERWLIENELKGLPGLDRAFAIAYPGLGRAAVQACGDVNFDISDVLEDHAASGEVYLDFCHANHVANRIIARRIFDLLFRSSRSPRPAKEFRTARSNDSTLQQTGMEAGRPATRIATKRRDGGLGAARRETTVDTIGKWAVLSRRDCHPEALPIIALQ